VLIEQKAALAADIAEMQVNAAALAMKGARQNRGLWRDALHRGQGPKT
jgi:hypothetical protein